MLGLGEPEGDADRTVERTGNEGRLLRLRAKVAEHEHGREIADNGGLVLQVVVKSETFRGEMVADHRHAEICAVLAAIFFRQRISQMAGLVGALSHFDEKHLPVMPGQALIVPVGARMFAAMIEEALIVVGGLQGLDFSIDKIIEHGEIIGNLAGDGEVHICPPSDAARAS